MINTKALILIGGKSTRMGTDKFQLTVNGKPQYQHIHEMLGELSIDTFISCSEEQRHSLPESYHIIEDIKSDTGPMGGIISAIQADSSCSWLVVACDLINLTKEGIEQLLNANDGSSGIVAYQKVNSPWYETTLAIYNPSSYDVLLDSFAKAHYKLQSVLQQCNVKAIHPIAESLLFNANKPEDL